MSNRLIDRIVTLLNEQVLIHEFEVNVLIAAQDAKSATSHAYSEAQLRIALDILKSYAAQREE